MNPLKKERLTPKHFLVELIALRNKFFLGDDASQILTRSTWEECVPCIRHAASKGKLNCRFHLRVIHSDTQREIVYAGLIRIARMHGLTVGEIRDDQSFTVYWPSSVPQ